MSAPTPADPTTTAAIVATVGPGASMLSVHLFVNQYYPVGGDLLGSFVEATFPGYLAAGGGNWLGPYVDENDLVYMIAPPITFTAGGAVSPTQTVYGWMVEQTVGGVSQVVNSDNLDLAIVIAQEGDSVTVEPFVYFHVLED